MPAAAGAALAIVPRRRSASTARPTGYFAAVGEANNLTVTDNGTTMTYVDTFVGTFDILEIDQFGGAGSDTLRGPATPPTSILGGARNFLPGEAGGDTLVGGPGPADIAYYRERTAGVAVSIDEVADDGEAGEADNVLSAVERITTGAGDDTITGNAADSILIAGAGNDTISGGAGDDGIDAEAGTDTLAGGEGDDDLYPGFAVAGRPDGADTITGGPGVDYAATYAEGRAPDYAPLDVTIRLNDAADDGLASEGDNYHSDIEDVTSLRGGNDTLTGTGAINVLSTAGGADSLSGEAGNDIFFSGDGDDTIDARDGFADRVDCGRGVDTATSTHSTSSRRTARRHSPPTSATRTTSPRTRGRSSRSQRPSRTRRCPPAAPR